MTHSNTNILSRLNHTISTLSQYFNTPTPDSSPTDKGGEYYSSSHGYLSISYDPTSGLNYGSNGSSGYISNSFINKALEGTNGELESLFIDILLTSSLFSDYAISLNEKIRILEYIKDSLGADDENK
jgi:hypothetical protein